MRHRTGMCVLMMILGLSLSACGGAEGGNRAEQLALDIRGEYLEMGGCTASLELTADYGQRVYTYGIGLNYAREGETTLTITAPENIAGVTARILEGETALEYDGMRVETGPLDDSGMSPVVWRPKGRARCCAWSAGSRSPPRARGGSAPSGLTRPPTPFCGGSCLRTALP